MSADLPLALGAGALVGGGLVAAVMFAMGTPRRAAPRRRLKVDLRKVGVRLAVGGGVGVAVLAVTRWVVLAAALGLLAAFWQRIFGGAAEERSGIRRLDALASWTESLRDTIAGAVGLEQAIPATSATAAPAIRPALNLLVDRLRIREPMPDALMRFADDMGDPSADLIVGALVLNARLRGPGLRDVLGALAASAREELDMRRRIESSRRSTRRSVQIVVGVTLGVAGLLIVLNRTYVEPYGTVVGQMVLLVVIALFTAGVVWLRRLARIEMPSRFLTGGPSPSGTAATRSAASGGVREDGGQRTAATVRYAATPMAASPASPAGTAGPSTSTSTSPTSSPSPASALDPVDPRPPNAAAGTWSPDTAGAWQPGGNRPGNPHDSAEAAS